MDLSDFYRIKNPITPPFIYHCIKRIFGRSSHSCLSNDNKPKVIEVLLKFTKLYDNVDLEDRQALRSHFDKVIHLDFMKFGEDEFGGLSKDTFMTIVEGINQTPENFRAPSDEVINKVLKAIEN